MVSLTAWRTASRSATTAGLSLSSRQTRCSSLYTPDGSSSVRQRTRSKLTAVALRGIVITLVAGTAAMLADLLPDALSLPLLGLIAAASIWLALRFALPLADRMSLGKTGRRLRLFEPEAA